MICQDIIQVLEKLSPKPYALGFDNVGLLVGDSHKEIKKIFVALDADEKTVDEAVSAGVDMLVTHHPMIFNAIKSVNEENGLGRKILKLAGNHICLYAMHTNFDVMGSMSDLAAKRLGLAKASVLESTADDGEGIGRIGEISAVKTLEDLADLVCKKFKLDEVIVYGDLKARVERIGIIPGSGKSMIDAAVEQGVDALVTGDFGHHEGLDAIEAGINVIDASHAGIERIFIPFMGEYLKEQLPEKIEIIEKDLQETVPGKFYHSK